MSNRMIMTNEMTVISWKTCWQCWRTHIDIHPTLLFQRFHHCFLKLRSLHLSPALMINDLSQPDFSSAASIAALRRANFLALTRKVGGLAKAHPSKTYPNMILTYIYIYIYDICYVIKCDMQIQEYVQNHCDLRQL